MSERHDHLTSRFHKALAESIKRAVDFPPGMIVTLVAAEITANTRFAKGVISVLPDSEAKHAIEMLEEYAPYIKEELNRKIRLRMTPSLHWELDYTEAEAAKIENAISDLTKMGDL